MAVNGIEIKVGQSWRTGEGVIVKICKNSDSSAREYPWLALGSCRTYDDYGRATAGRASLDDLCELITPGAIQELKPNESIQTPTPPAVNMSVPGYEALANVLQRAYDQASIGKGKERHARGEPFDQQLMQVGAAKFGHGSLLFQAFKKSEESLRLPTDAAVRELLGAINYLAGAVVFLEKKEGA